MNTSAAFIVYAIISAGAALGSIATFLLYRKEIKVGHHIIAKERESNYRPLPRAKIVKKVKKPKVEKEYDGSDL